MGNLLAASRVDHSSDHSLALGHSFLDAVLGTVPGVFAAPFVLAVHQGVLVLVDQIDWTARVVRLAALPDCWYRSSFVVVAGTWYSGVGRPFVVVVPGESYPLVVRPGSTASPEFPLVRMLRPESAASWNHQTDSPPTDSPTVELALVSHSYYRSFDNLKLRKWNPVSGQENSLFNCKSRKSRVLLKSKSSERM